MIRTLAILSALLCLGAAIFYSVVPPPEPTRLPGLTKPMRKWIHSQRPIRHAPGYFLVALTCQAAWAGSGPRRVLEVAALLILVAGFLEILQVWVPRRHPSWPDLGWSSVGIVLGSLPWLLYPRRVK